MVQYPCRPRRTIPGRQVWCALDLFQSTSLYFHLRWGYCQREGCEFRTPLFAPSPRPSTTSTPEVIKGTENETSIELNTDTPIVITPLPQLPLPDLLPPPGTPIRIPCGMFDPIQVNLFLSHPKFIHPLGYSASSPSELLICCLQPHSQ